MSSDATAWARLQESLREDDCYTLLTFAERRAAAALRLGQPAPARHAVAALSMVTRDKIDYRDLSVDFALFAVRETGGDLAAAIDVALTRSEPGTRAAFKARAGSAGGLSLRDCGYIAVQSRYGLGLMETWAEQIPRRSDLPATAIAIADRIDEGARYVVESVRLSALPRVWLGMDVRAGVDVPGHGGVMASANLAGSARWSHGLLVFLSDLGDAATAQAVADLVRGASSVDRPRTALSDGPLVLTVVGGSSTAQQKPVESTASLEAIRDDLAYAAGLLPRLA